MMSDRTWFTCHICRIECDIRAVAPDWANKPLKICKVCERSYCPYCDSLMRPSGSETHRYATCPECGYDDITVSRAVLHNIDQLNHEAKEHTR